MPDIKPPVPRGAGHWWGRVACSRLGALLLWFCLGRMAADVAHREVEAEVAAGATGIMVFRVDPSLGTVAYRLTERLPSGVEWLGASHGGSFDPVKRTVSWRGFNEGRIAVLTCDVRFPSVSGPLDWSGEVEFDGRLSAVQGRSQSRVAPRSQGSVLRRIDRTPWATGSVEWVELDATPQPGTLLWVVEEEIEGASRLQPADDGRLVGVRRIRWGPFTDDRPRRLRYEVSAGNLPGEIRFRGTTSFQDQTGTIDGVASVPVIRPTSVDVRRRLPPEATAGDTIEIRLEIELPSNPGIYSVRETVPVDWRVVDSSPLARREVDGALVWGPLTEGGRQSLSYRVALPADWSAAAVLEGALDWAEGRILTTGDTVLLPAERIPVRATRSLPAIYIPGQPVSVGVRVEPGTRTGLHRVTERLPVGWTLAPGSPAQLLPGQIQFGPFFDAEIRELYYEAIPGPDSGSTAVFDGWVDAAEGRIPVGGAAEIVRRPPPSGSFEQFLPPFFAPGGEVVITNRVRPDPEVVFLVIEQVVPPGWVVLGSEPPGRLSADSRRWIWGPLSDGRAVDVVVRMRVPAGAEASVEVPVLVNLGETVLSAPGPVVLPVNLPPRVPQIFEVFGRKNEPVRLRIPVQDPETPTAQLDLRYSLSDSTLFPESGRSSSTEPGSFLLLLEPGLNRIGVATVTLDVGDGFNEVRRTFRVEVLDRNTPPTLEGWDRVDGAIEDSPEVTLGGLRVGDLDAGQAPVRVTLTLPTGFRFLAGTTDPQVVSSFGEHPGVLLLQGSITPLNGQLETLRFVPAPDWSGVVPVSVEVDDPGATGPGGPQRVSDRFTVNLDAVNDPPLFDRLQPGTRIRVFENSPADQTRLDGFLTGLRPGPADEEGQRLVPVVSVDNPSLFALGPTLTREGSLVFELIPEAVGVSRVEFQFVDDGGTSNGGIDRSVSEAFEIEVVGVNRAPTGRRGDERTEWTLAGAGEVPVAHRWEDFLTEMHPGHPREADAGQAVRVEAWVTPRDLLMVPPRVEEDGDLVVVPRPFRGGQGTLFWQLVDDGPSGGPHRNQSAIGQVGIRLVSSNDPPRVSWDGPWTLFSDPDRGGWSGGLPGISPGRFERRTDQIDLALSSATVHWMDPSGVDRSMPAELTAYSAVSVDPVPAFGVLRVHLPALPGDVGDLRIELDVSDTAGARVRDERALLLVDAAPPIVGSWGRQAPWNRADPDTGLPLIRRDEDAVASGLDLAELFPDIRGDRDWSWRFHDMLSTPVRLGSGEGTEVLDVEPVPDAHGEVLVQSVLTRGSVRVPWAFVIRVDPMPDPPRVDPVPDLSIPENLPWSYRLQGVSVENPGLSPVWELLEAPGGLVLRGDGSLSWTPSESQGPGVHRVRVRASEPDGSRWSDVEFSISVLEDNRPPTLAATGPLEGDEHEQVRVWIGATDPDWPPQELFLELLEAPPGMTLAPGASGAWVEWTPGEEHGGAIWTFRLRVTDAGDPPLVAERAYGIAVRERNDAPWIEPITLTEPQALLIPDEDRGRVVAWVVLDEDSIGTVPLTIRDPEDDPPKVVVVTPPLHGRISGDHPELTYTPDADYFGFDRVELAASDGSLSSAVMVVWIQIRPLPDPPVTVTDLIDGSSGDAVEIRGEDLVANDRLVDGLPGRVMSITGRGLIQPEVTGDGTWMLRLPESFRGTEDLQYVLRSGSYQVTGEIRVEVSGEWDGPMVPRPRLQGRGGEPLHWTDADLLSGIQPEDRDGLVIDGGRDQTEIGRWAVRRHPELPGWEATPVLEGGRDRWVFRVRNRAGQVQTVLADIDAGPASPVLRMVHGDSPDGNILLELSALPNGRYRILRSEHWGDSGQAWREGTMPPGGLIRLPLIPEPDNVGWFRAEWFPNPVPDLVLAPAPGGLLSLRVAAMAGRQVRVVAASGLFETTRTIARIQIPWDGVAHWVGLNPPFQELGFLRLEEGW